MDRRTARRFSREFKLSALARMESGDNVSALSRDLDVRRKLLYEWRDAYKAGGADALNLARHRIAELERKVGQQVLEADFFRQALRLLESCRGASGRSGGSASSAWSGPGRGGKAD